jgi:hypothetical protein
MHVPEKPGILIRTITGLFGCLCCVSLALSLGAEDSHRDRLELTIEADDNHELCMVLAADQQLRYEFTSTRKLDFNIHYHVDHEVFYPVSEEQVTTADATFMAPSEQEYCLMWTNPGDMDALLSLEYEKPQPIREGASAK